MRNSTHLKLDFLFVAQNSVVLERCRTAASQNCHSCQFADKWRRKQCRSGEESVSFLHIIHLCHCMIAITRV